jgi:hypothetical protein
MKKLELYDVLYFWLNNVNSDNLSTEHIIQK